VDRYAANGSVNPVDLTENKESTVKVAGGFGPVRFEPSQMTWLERPTAQAVATISSAGADLILQDMLNTGIMCAVAAIENQAGATVDVSGSPAAGITQSVLNRSHAKFGDQSGRLIAEVMTGSVYHKLIGQNITNDNALFSSDGVTVVDILGKVAVVTDAPALFEAVSGADGLEKVLSLVAGAVKVTDAKDIITNIQTSNGKERIETTVQMDYSFAVGLKGYTWDEQNGGKSPTDAELATGSNWDKVASDIKQTAGVIAVGDAGEDN
jgi:hypothetical protein